MNEPKIIIEAGTRYFYDENEILYQQVSFSRVYKVSVPEGKEKKNEWKKRKKIKTVG